MVKKVFEASATGDAAPEFGHDAGNLAQAVSVGNLHPDAVAIAGNAALAAAEQTERLTVKAKDEKAREFMIQLMRVDAYLQRMDDMIAAMEADIAALIEQRLVLTEQAQAAYERSFEADDLIKAIKDGISPEERERLVTLLGPDAANASIDELKTLLEAEEKTARSEGDKLTAQAQQIQKQIDNRKAKLDDAKALRDEYKDASPERRKEIENELDSMLDPAERTANAENAVSTSPDFTVALS